MKNLSIVICLISFCFGCTESNQKLDFDYLEIYYADSPYRTKIIDKVKIDELQNFLKEKEVTPSPGSALFFIDFYKKNKIIETVWVFPNGNWGYGENFHGKGLNYSGGKELISFLYDQISVDFEEKEIPKAFKPHILR